MTIQSSLSVRRAASQAADPATAIAELRAGLDQPNIGLAVFFCSPHYDRQQVAEALKSEFEGVPLIGCTTAGEIGPLGYAEDGISGFSLSGDDFKIETALITNLQNLALDQGHRVAQTAMAQLSSRCGALTTDNTFGFLLVDGLSAREEGLVSSIHRPLGDIHLFGGSAGDGLNFGQTQIWHDSQFHDDAAVVNLIHTDLPFKVFRTQHFEETDAKLVVTEADPLSRTVTEINAEPAAREYAKVVGLEVNELTPMIFSAHPVVLRVGGEIYVRSIAKVNEDESLSFFCAIEPGIVLTVAKGLDMVAGLQNAFDEIRGEIGDPQLTIGCDCILRSLESQDTGIRNQLASIFEQNGTIGFATYGEQFDSMHVNQTFTGVYIGQKND
jgi:hypothetical protein